MSGPYITTLLSATVNLNPRQMDNKIYKNLKDNLIKKIEGRCYKNYGYISKIYNIKEYSEGILIPENPMAAATYAVKFTCRLCNPLRKKQIVFKIMKINNMFISAQNGPITLIITMNRINNDVFYQEPKTGKLMKKTTNKPVEITPGSYIIATVESRTFNDMDSIIMALGELYRMATEEEIKSSFIDEHTNIEENIKDFSEYMQKDNEEEKYNENDEDLTSDEREEEELQND